MLALLGLAVVGCMSAPVQKGVEWLPLKTTPERDDDRLHLWIGTEPTRPRVTPRPFSIASLPHARMPTPLAASTAPAENGAPHMVIDDWVDGHETKESDAPYLLRLTVAKNGVAEGSFSGWASPRIFGRFAATWDLCRHMHPLAPRMPSRWASLEVRDDGDAVYTVGDAWLSGVRCDGWIAQLGRVVAHRIHPSAAIFAFVDTSEPSAPDLVVLMPEGGALATTTEGVARVDASPIGVARIPLRRGSGGAAFDRLRLADLVPWYQALGMNVRVPKGGTKELDEIVLLGVELTPTDGEEPLAVAWAGATVLPVPPLIDDEDFVFESGRIPLE
jgi:hypothetical protein